ncbi:MAG: PH domain-containing protein [Cumulibacter sp.]
MSISKSKNPAGTGQPMQLIARPRKLIIWSAIAAVVIALVFIIMGVMLKRSEAGTIFTLGDQIGIGGVGIILAAGCLMFTRPRVWANSTHITVRNVFQTTTLPWEVVRDVGVSQGSAWGLLDLQDDDQLSMLGLQVADGQSAVDGMHRLRELHAAALGLDGDQS